MKTVKELLQGKPKALCTVNPDTRVFEALKLMAEKDIGALLVVEGAKLAGILSERDYARKVILKGRSSKDTPIRDIMSAPVLTVTPHDTVNHCMKLVTDKRVRHLPVVEGGRVIGVLSIGDLVKAVIDDQAEQLEQLQRYISG